MNGEFYVLLSFLSFAFFLSYWIFGGVFFALVAIARLGRVRKVRFSCLFSALSLALAIGASFVGLRVSEDAMAECLVKAQTKAEAVTAVFGCGFAGVFGAFLVGAAALVLGGFAIMAISQPKTKSWFHLNHDDESARPEEGEDEPAKDESFFETKE